MSVWNPDAHVVPPAADGAGLLRAATVGAQLLRLIPPEKSIGGFPFIVSKKKLFCHVKITQTRSSPSFRRIAGTLRRTSRSCSPRRRWKRSLLPPSGTRTSPGCLGKGGGAPRKIRRRRRGWRPGKSAGERCGRETSLYLYEVLRQWSVFRLVQHSAPPSPVISRNRAIMHLYFLTAPCVWVNKAIAHEAAPSENRFDAN